MIRAKIKSWTASFRYPFFQAGYQPTLSVPPLSTIQGLLSAAKGEIISLSSVSFVGYIFKSAGSGVDLERIYPLGKHKTDVMKREILFDNTLYLYLPKEWKEYLIKPRFQILLGRSEDIATVEEVEEVKLETRRDVPLGGTIVPLTTGLPGMLQALPVEFDYSAIPRRIKRADIFTILQFPQNDAQRRHQTYRKAIEYDADIGLGVWLYKGKAL